MKIIFDTLRVRKIAYINMIWTIFYNMLIHSSCFERLPVVGRLWRFFWESGATKAQNCVTTRVHGRRIKLPFGYPYPFYARNIRKLNAPLVELAFQTYKALSRPICIVDVGSAIGDTFLLIHANCPGMISKALCIEGDPTFFGLLRDNLAEFTNVTMVNAILSSSQGQVRTLERIHPGTSSALGEGTEFSSTLDDILSMNLCETVDLLKIDVDGFDGEVLNGACRTLEKDKPTVIFEWHPLLCRKTGNCYYRHFDVLETCGYRTYIWFDKFGNFSHYTTDTNRDTLDLLANTATENLLGADWHYDVIALHQDSHVSTFEVVALRFAVKRLSRY